MGCSEYTGIGSALDSASLANLEKTKEDDDADDNNNDNDNDNNVNNVNIDDYECFTLSKTADNAFTLLKNYLNKWNEDSLQD